MNLSVWSEINLNCFSYHRSRSTQIRLDLDSVESGKPRSIHEWKINLKHLDLSVEKIKWNILANYAKCKLSK